MKSYKKNYIGKGREVTTKSGQVLDIVKITLSVEEMMKRTCKRFDAHKTHYK